MNKQDKPRICEVLGVEVGERFTINKKDVAEYYVVSPNGTVVQESPVRGIVISSIDLAWIINQPECIVRRKRFTEQEIEDAKAIKRLILYALSVERGKDRFLHVKRYGDYGVLSSVDLQDGNLFPSILPRESYTLDEIIGEG